MSTNTASTFDAPRTRLWGNDEDWFPFPYTKKALTGTQWELFLFPNSYPRLLSRSADTPLDLAPPHCRTTVCHTPFTFLPQRLLRKEGKRTKKESKKNGKRTQLRYDVGSSKARTLNGYFCRTRKFRNKRKSSLLHFQTRHFVLLVFFALYKNISQSVWEWIGVPIQSSFPLFYTLREVIELTGVQWISAFFARYKNLSQSVWECIGVPMLIFHALPRDVIINPSIELNLNLIFWWRESYATQLLT